MELNFNIIIDFIGAQTPGILFTLSLFFLRNQIRFLYFFTSGFILNLIINILLKICIKEPRPNTDKKVLEIGIVNGARVGFDKYGMPSGHAQTAGFCLTFISLVLRSPFITGLYLILTTNTIFQRYLYNNHTAFQLIIGLLVGIIFGYLYFLIGDKYIVGNIKFKKDDDSSIFSQF